VKSKNPPVVKTAANSNIYNYNKDTSFKNLLYFSFEYIIKLVSLYFSITQNILKNRNFTYFYFELKK